MIVRTWMTPCGGQEANMHLIACESSREGAVIDAGGFPDEMRDEIERLGLRITQVLITHAHFDHVEALDEIRRAHTATVRSADRVTRDTEPISDGDELRVGELRGRVVRTSGHTPDSISFIFEERVAFTGDALFAGSIGGASGAAQLEEIRLVREKILTLPDDCEIRPGHGPASTVEIERVANPFFR